MLKIIVTYMSGSKKAATKKNIVPTRRKCKVCILSSLQCFMNFAIWINSTLSKTFNAITFLKTVNQVLSQTNNLTRYSAKWLIFWKHAKIEDVWFLFRLSFVAWHFLWDLRSIIICSFRCNPFYLHVTYFQYLNDV